MTVQAILAPVFAQVLLIFVLMVWMGRVRFAEIKAGSVAAGDVSLGERNWPPRAQRSANAFSNQFELPMLFFALVPLALYTKKADLLFVVLAWLFVTSRAVHAGVYVTSNHVPSRFRAYALGALVLLAMWIVFAVRIFLAPIGL
ncbi:MAPEG family protein [Methylobacterium sp. E-045]|uniref:MAPEG family protein n=1 Tax=Methylobacterium sp. E-045 TaxID=2836575 RepID=UPI001FBAD181|nr:MAPEG family protein [Methylobacterium sp. E-045]MCJ2130700.1 MAPEG family protein [Methylobacterium sp. E-045]